jgi:hypothetical protein
MRQKLFFASLALLLLAPAAARAQADVDEHKSEVGAFYTGVNLQGFGEAVHGLGGRFGYNINKHLAVDAEGSFFPETHLGNEQVGQKTQGFVGVKAGVRRGRFGAFAKARPGVMFIGELTSGFNCSRSGSVTRCTLNHNNFALDAGGVLELYPSSRAIVRFDAGDTIVRIHRTAANSDPLILPGIASTTTHNFQFSVGFGYRF